MPRSETTTLATALRILAGQIQSPDDVPATALREAADRLEELREANSNLLWLAKAAPCNCSGPFVCTRCLTIKAAECGDRDKADRTGIRTEAILSRVYLCLDQILSNEALGHDPDWFDAVHLRQVRDEVGSFLNETFWGQDESAPAMIHCDECGDSWPASQGLGCDCKERLQAKRA